MQDDGGAQRGEHRTALGAVGRLGEQPGDAFRVARVEALRNDRIASRRHARLPSHAGGRVRKASHGRGTPPPPRRDRSSACYGSSGNDV